MSEVRISHPFNSFSCAKSNSGNRITTADDSIKESAMQALRRRFSTKEEIHLAETVREVRRRLGYCSDRDLATMLFRGRLNNAMWTSADVWRAKELLRQRTEVLLGRSTRKQAPLKIPAQITMYTRTVQQIHADRIYVSQGSNKLQYIGTANAKMYWSLLLP